MPQEIVDIHDVEADFVNVARSHGDRKGISYGTWRTVGGPAGALRSAGVPRTRSA